MSVRSAMTELVLTLLLVGAGLVGTTTFHFEALRLLKAASARLSASRQHSLALIMLAIVAAHLIEIGFFAVLLAAAAGPLALGHFAGAPAMRSLDYFYFAAETYSSMGFGDIVPTAGLRLIVSVVPLNGLLLLAWSGAFLFASVTEIHDAGRPPRR